MAFIVKVSVQEVRSSFSFVSQDDDEDEDDYAEEEEEGE